MEGAVQRVRRLVTAPLLGSLEHEDLHPQAGEDKVGKANNGEGVMEEELNLAVYKDGSCQIGSGASWLAWKGRGGDSGGCSSRPSHLPYGVQCRANPSPLPAAWPGPLLIWYLAS